MAREFDEVGERYPTLTLYDETQARTDLLSTAGGADFLLVSYCAIWCGPCRDFAEALPQIAAAVGGEVAFVEVVMQRFSGIPSSDPQDAALWAAEHGFGPSGAARVLTTGDDRATYDLVMDGAGVAGFPRYHLVRADTGAIVDIQAGYDTAQRLVDFVQDGVASYRPPAPPRVEFGDGGPDALTGADGDDALSGRGGDDVIFGRAGYDVLKGGAGSDEIRGGAQGDVIDGNRGDDRLFGDRGNDVIRGGRGDDLLVGGAGDDVLVGGSGNDVLRGGRDDDVLRGGSGRDRLDGVAGENVLFGGAGDDRLVMRERSESSYVYSDMYGGAGADTFVLISGVATIHDLEDIDRIRLGDQVRDLDIFEFGGVTEVFLLDRDGEELGVARFPDMTRAEIEALFSPF